MLIPKRVKHRKQFRGRMKGRAMRGNTVSHGEFGLVACEPSWITNRQIEAARIAMTRYIKRGDVVFSFLSSFFNYYCYVASAFQNFESLTTGTRMNAF